MTRRGVGAGSVDIDATIVTACSEKEQAMPTWKTYGHHPLTAFADHGAQGAGEALAVLGQNAGSNTTADHIGAGSLAQLPRHLRRRVLITDSGGGASSGLAPHLAMAASRWASPSPRTCRILAIPDRAWTPA